MSAYSLLPPPPPAVRRRALLDRITHREVRYYHGGISKISSPHIVFALISPNATTPLVSDAEDEADILAFLTRLEFYLSTAHHWSVAVSPHATRPMDWWAHRAALDDVFGGVATDFDATQLHCPGRQLDKNDFRRFAFLNRRTAQIWSATSNMVPWRDIKSIATRDFDSGRKSSWARALRCHSTKIDLKRPGKLVDRMIRLTSLVAGEPPASAWSERGLGLLSPGLGKSTKRSGSTVSVNEVDAAA